MTHGLYPSKNNHSRGFILGIRSFENVVEKAEYSGVIKGKCLINTVEKGGKYCNLHFTFAQFLPFERFRYQYFLFFTFGENMT